MKVLHIIYTFSVAGAEKHLQYLLPGLKKFNIEPHLIIICPSATHHLLTQFIADLNVEAVPTSLIDANKLKFIFAAQKIGRYCREHKINIIHSHLSNSDLLAVIVKKFFLKKVFLVSTKHGYSESALKSYEPGITKINKNLYYYATKYLQKNIDKSIAVSQTMSDIYYNFGLTKSKCPVIYHGVSVPEFDVKTYEKECRKAEHQLVIIGRMEPIKGHQFLVEAMTEVVKVFPLCKLLIVGNGTQKEVLKKQVQSSDLCDNIEFVGFQSFPYPYISHSDVVVLPSGFESFGLVFVEAFALKTPVVAFDVPAGNEIMEHNKTGLLVPKGNTALLAEKIIFLLKHQEERIRLSNNAYETFLKKFSIEKMVADTALFYAANFK